MDKMREIGCRLKAEQNLAADDIAWLVVIAKAVLRAFVWDEGQPMRTLAEALGVSPTTFYTTLRLAVQALMLVRRGKQSVETLAGRVRQLRDRLVQVEQAYATAQAEVWRLTEALAEAQAIVATLQVQVDQLHAQWTVTQKRLIVVLKMSGRCTVRSIVVVLGSFAVTLGLYQVFIRRINAVRGLFGMKQEKRGAGVQTQARE